MKLVLLFLFISISIFAAEINKEEFKKKYLLGVETFKKKEYQKSLEIFEELFEIKSDEPDVNFYMGRAAFELKDYEGALIAYDRVLISSPDSLRTKLEVARTYFLLKSYDRSKKGFKEILSLNIPKEVKANVDRYLNEITKAQQKHTITGIGMFSVTSESNIDNRTANAANNVPLVGDLPNTVIDANDIATQQILLVNHVYTKSDDVLYKNDMMLFNKAYKEYGNHNILLMSYSPTFSKIYNDKISVDYSLFYDYLVYASEHLLDTYGIFPKITYKIDDKNSLKLGYKLSRKNNIESGKTKDSDTHQISADLVKILDEKNTLTPTFKFARETRKSYSLQTVNNDTFNFGLSHAYIYNSNFFLASSIGYEIKEYKYVDSLYFKKHKNRKTDLSFSATYLTKNIWLIQGAFSFSKQSSNFEKDNYDKNSFAINFVKPF